MHVKGEEEMSRIPIYEGYEGSYFFFVVMHDRAKGSMMEKSSGFSIEKEAGRMYLEKFFLRFFDETLRINKAHSKVHDQAFYSQKTWMSILEEIHNENVFLKNCFKNLTGKKYKRAEDMGFYSFDGKEKNTGIRDTSFSDGLMSVIEFYERFTYFSKKMISKSSEKPYIMVKRN